MISSMRQTATVRISIGSSFRLLNGLELFRIYLLFALYIRIRKVKSKTVPRTIKNEQVKLCRKCIQNMRKREYE